MQGFTVIFYGDSITESWRGTSAGGACDRCSGVPQIFQKFFTSKYPAAALAISGDQTAHLAWRLQNGELPQKIHPKVAVIMISTNDLGHAAYLARETSDIEAEITAEAAPAAKRYLVEKALHADKFPTQVCYRSTDYWF